jgi:Fe2+ transport system protein B
LRKKWKFEAALIDTPGTYSLTPRTIEEEVTYRVLSEGLGKAVSSVVITVVDATQLSRHLLLVRQLQRAGYRPIVALSMTDLMRSAGQDIDVKKLSSILEAPVVRINALTGEGVAELIDQTRVLVESMGAAHSQKISRLSQSQPEDLSHQETEKFLNEAVAISKTVICGDLQSRRQADLRTQRWDRVLLHPFWGLLVFVLVMSSVFSTIFWLSAPMMDLIDGFFAWSAEQVLELAPQAAWSDLVANGILASLGAVLVFLPQIALLFLFMSLLESSGYLARAASLVDKPLSFLGMNGRSFVPLLSGYACAIPAMLAARTIPSRRERWITLFIVPLMSCSARLPVYALLLSFVFRDESSRRALFWKLMDGVGSGFCVESIHSGEGQVFFLDGAASLSKAAWAIGYSQRVLKDESLSFGCGPRHFCFCGAFVGGDSISEGSRSGSRAATFGQLCCASWPIFRADHGANGGRLANGYCSYRRLCSSRSFCLLSCSDSSCEHRRGGSSFWASAKDDRCRQSGWNSSFHFILGHWLSDFFHDCSAVYGHGGGCSSRVWRLAMGHLSAHQL